jgi:2-oxo-3-hexenedioate decarboxylase/2-keto-4-pentenoate hydratase
LATDRFTDAASLLAAARLAGVPLEPLPVMMRPRDEAEAYWIQTAVHRLISRSRYGAIAGYRVGAASPAAQHYLGVKKPYSVGVFSGTMHRTGVTLRCQDFQRMGMDCDIAVRLSKDLPSADGPFDAASVAGAVESYLPAIAIVDDRYVDWRRTDTPTLIADDFFAAASVIGAPVKAAELGDPAALEGKVTVNGQEIAKVTARDLMGHPMNALVWLANAMIERGDQLRAGATIFLGGLIQTRWLNVKDRVTFEMGRLGRVDFNVVD